MYHDIWTASILVMNYEDTLTDPCPIKCRRRRSGPLATYMREREDKERERDRRSRKIRGYKDVNHNPPKSQTQRLPVVMIFFFVQNRKV